MIPLFVIKHYAFKHHCSLEISIDKHLKLLDYFNEVQQMGTAVPSKEVDEVWHNFILHTRLYREFCHEKFGKFIEHNPHLPDNIDQVLAEKTTRPVYYGKCDNQCNGSGKCDVKCSGEKECDNDCNGNPSSCDSDEERGKARKSEFGFTIITT